MFGDWTDDIAALAEQFQQSAPFEHVVIPNFFSADVLARLMAAFPPVEASIAAPAWKHYDNPIEQKYALNDFTHPALSDVKGVFDGLQTDATVALMRRITGIHDLETDPHLHGAGLHAYPKGGKLDVHLDYSIHPISGKERRLNLIVYLNRDWKEEYGGHLQLWDAELETCTELILPTLNTAVLFRTSDISYHGVPKPISCPEGMFRKSLAIYYVSPARANIPLRPKAEFSPLPWQPVDDRLRRLYDIRRTRLITADDLAEWPEWRTSGGGYW